VLVPEARWRTLGPKLDDDGLLRLATMAIDGADGDLVNSHLDVLRDPHTPKVYAAVGDCALGLRCSRAELHALEGFPTLVARYP